MYKEPSGDACDSYHRYAQDFAIARAIGKSRLTLLSAEARTSAAKYERDGWRRRAYSNAWLLGCYLMGASPERLARHYT